MLAWRGALPGDTDVAVLEAELERTQRALRQLRAVGVVALVLLSALAVPPFYRTVVASHLRVGVVEADGLIVRDASGASRALLGMADDGAVVLRFLDGAGRPRATLGVGREGHPALGLADTDGRLRAAMAVGESGDGNVVTFDERGQSVSAIP